MFHSIFFRFRSGAWLRATLALGLFCVAEAAQASTITLTTPTGLNNGDKFRFLFLTQSTRDATSSNIADYNSFVNTAAGGATYAGTAVSWAAFGNTATVGSAANVGGFGSSVPVYLTNGTKIANDMSNGSGGLWSGSLLSTPNVWIDGTTSTSADPFVWTGGSGPNPPFYSYLGDTFGVYNGDSTKSNSKWLVNAGVTPSETHAFYGVSAELTVGGSSPVPEIDPAGMGSVLALVTGALGLVERRRLKAKGA
jgi:hypothetical protein